MGANWQFLNQKLWLSVPLIISGFLIYCGNTVVAQVTPDQTLDKESSVVTPVNSNTNRIDGGAVRGSNLFHSFQDFNVGEGRRVDFANPAGIENILSRVTGSNASRIFGTLGVLGNANLYLLNPNGIIFGQNARLDIRGSFVASTGKGVTFEDRILYGANNHGSKPLLTMAVPVGLQYGTQQGGNINNAGNLKVEQGQKLALVGNTVTTSGQLIAPGGTVHVLGSRVGLVDNARIDVSGDTGGGDVLIGGDFQGKGQVPNAKRTFVAPGVNINADALTSGDGGRVIVWGDEITGFYGNISARGGSLFGNGGFAEVSGEESLIFRGNVDLGAINGDLGTLLLDPENIRITSGTNAANDGQLPNILFATDPGEDYTISQTALEQQTGNVVLEASENITVVDDLSLNFNAPGGSIKLTADADNNGSGNFLMDSEESINTSGRDIEILGASLKLGDINTSSGSGDGGKITLKANNGGITTGSLISQYSGSGSNIGGAVDLEAIGDINTKYILTAPGGSANVADVNLTSYNGSIRINEFDTNIFSITGKSITINNLDTLFVAGALNARSDQLGNAGNINIGDNDLLVPSSIEIGAISTRNLGNGSGGNVNIKTPGLLSLTGAFSRSEGKVVDINNPNNRPSDLASIASEASDNGGEINIFADGGIIIVAGIASNSLTSGNAGEINLTSNNGAINIQAGTVDSSSTSGDGGEINFNAASNITTGSIFSNSSFNGKGGDIILTSDTGAIDTSAGDVNSFSTSSDGGEINFNAASNITTGSIFSNSNGNGKGGNITLTSRNGEIDTSAGILNAFSQFGVDNGGNVTLDAKSGNIFSGSIESTGLQGGNITFNSSNKISLNQADIVSISTGNSGKGNNIEFTAPTISLTDARVANISTGNIRAGDIIVKAFEEVEITNKGGSSPNLIGESSLLQFLKQQPDFRGTGFISTTLLGNGDTGNITIDTKKLSIRKNAPADFNTRTGVATLTLQGSSYNAGDIIVNASESVKIDGNEPGAFNPAPGSNINDATDVAREIQSIRTGITSATQGSGNAGKTTINTGNLEISNGAAITSGITDEGTGEGSEITVNAATVKLSGKAALATASFGANTDSFGSNPEQIGDLTVNSEQITLLQGALIAADTFGSRKGGDLNINTNELKISDGSRISAATFDIGEGGTIRINTPENKAQLVQIEGTSKIDGISAENQARSGIFSDSRASGNAGNIEIFADTLDVKNSGEVSVSSFSSGFSGDLNINAGSIFLSNQARLNASTEFNKGGDINIEVADSIIMRNNGDPNNATEISSTAFGDADGGDITFSQVGSIILGYISENSDVVATAEKGQGGEVNAESASGRIFGFRQFNQVRTPESDFSADALQGQDGVVRGEQGDVPPQIPQETRVRDIPQVCPATQGITTRAVGKSQFTNVGRGGLPPNPGEVLNSNTPQVPWVTLDSNPSNTASKPQVIKEAQGWVNLPNGKVRLTAHTSTSTSTSCVIGSSQQ